MKTTISTLFLAAAMLSLMVACSDNANNAPVAADAGVTSSAVTSASGGQMDVKDDESNPNVVKVAINSKDHTTLVAAVKAAGLVETLSSAGPFTVFAPTNEAFNMLPAGTVDNLLKPENKMQLSSILTYHVVAGRLTYADLKRQIQEGHGKAMLKTVNGATLWAVMNGEVSISLKDGAGMTANISVYDVIQSNGVIHSIDRVLLPK